MADAAAMPARLGEVLIPGDTAFALPPTGQIRIGGGLQQVGESVAATRAGRLSHTQVAVGRPGAPKVDKFWVQGTQKRSSSHEISPRRRLTQGCAGTSLRWRTW